MTQENQDKQQDHKKAQRAQSKGLAKGPQGFVPAGNYPLGSFEDDDQMDDGALELVQQAHICPYCGFDCGLYCESEHPGVRHW